VHCFKLISLDQVKELKCFILDVFQAYIKLKGRRHSSIHCCFVLVKKSPYWAACSPYEEGTLLALYAISILCSGLLNSVFRVRPLGLSSWSIKMFNHFYFAILLCSRLGRVLSLPCSMCCLQPASVYSQPMTTISIYQATRLPVRNALNPRVNSIDSSVASKVLNRQLRYIADDL
jgi:hypothetical protein